MLRNHPKAGRAAVHGIELTIVYDGTHFLLRMELFSNIHLDIISKKQSKHDKQRIFITIDLIINIYILLNNLEYPFCIHSIL